MATQRSRLISLIKLIFINFPGLLFLLTPTLITIKKYLMEPEELTVKDLLVAPRTKIKSMSQITDCSSHKNFLHKKRISTRNSLNSTGKEVVGFIDWPIEKIVE